MSPCLGVPGSTMTGVAVVDVGVDHRVAADAQGEGFRSAGGGRWARGEPASSPRTPKIRCTSGKPAAMEPANFTFSKAMASSPGPS
jgi:hypothetical protein